MVLNQQRLLFPLISIRLFTDNQTSSSIVPEGKVANLILSHNLTIKSTTVHVLSDIIMLSAISSYILQYNLTTYITDTCLLLYFIINISRLKSKVANLGVILGLGAVEEDVVRQF